MQPLIRRKASDFYEPADFTAGNKCSYYSFLLTQVRIQIRAFKQEDLSTCRPLVKGRSGCRIELIF